MYVCLCKAITDKQIKDAAYNGATSMRCLNKDLGVATQCGKCAVTAKQILREHKAKLPSLIHKPLQTLWMQLWAKHCSKTITKS